MFKNYFKTAWRSLWKHPKTAIINLVGLTIGMASAVLITLWVQNELRFDNYHPDADNIYRIKSTLKISPTETWYWDGASYQLGYFAGKQIPEVKSVTRMYTVYDGLLINNNGRIIKEKNCAYVDSNWFNIFRYQFAAGNVDAFNANPNSIILTESMAKKYFGNQDAVGKLLRIDTANYQVQAVLKDNPANSSFQQDFLLPVAARFASPQNKKNDMSWGNYSYLTFLKLRPGSDIDAIGKKLIDIQRKNQAKSSSAFSLISLKDIHFESDIQNSRLAHGNRKMVNVFGVMAVLLMVTACINYVNLTTARASLRAKEVSVRKIIGAGKSHLFGQFMAESFIITGLSLLSALLVIQLSMPFYNAITDKHFAPPLANSTTWFILVTALLFCTVLNGIYPAITLSSFNPLNVFRGKSLLGVKDAGLRKGLVVVQFTISVVLIVATLVIYLQMRFLRNTDLGYDKAHVFTVQLPWQVIRGDQKKNITILAAIKNELEQQSPVQQLSQATDDLVDIKGGSSGGFDWNGRPAKFEPAVVPVSVSIDFKDMMKLQMQSGKWFTAADKHNVILNETAVKEFGIQKPVIGQRFVNRDDTGVVIGVVKDFHYKTLHEKIGAVVLDIHPEYQACFYVKSRPGQTEKALDAVKAIWKKYVADEPFAFSFIDEHYDSLYRDDQRVSALITFFACIAIMVSSLGLLGLAAFAAEQRVKEIGIRKVLGASVKSIVGLLSTDFVKMVVLASVLAFPLAWWAMSKWLQDFAYRINLSWWMFVVAGFITLLVAIATVGFQALRAAVVNPVKSLRSE